MSTSKQLCHPDSVAGRGETASMDAVVAQQDALRRYALRLCRDVSDADDLVQETLARAVKNAASLPHPDMILRWLMVTLWRLFIDQCRRRKAESKAHEGISYISRAATAARPVELPRWMTVSDDELRSAVEDLPDKLRVPYVLRARGRSYQQISDTLGIGINTVATRIRRARLALRGALTDKVST